MAPINVLLVGKRDSSLDYQLYYEQGIHLTFAGESEEGIEYLQTINFDIILTDLELEDEGRRRLSRLIELEQPQGVLHIAANFTREETVTSLLHDAIEKIRQDHKPQVRIFDGIPT